MTPKVLNKEETRENRELDLARVDNKITWAITPSTHPAKKALQRWGWDGWGVNQHA